MTRVAVYARYSSENQREASIDDQLRICRVRADREGWQVVATFTDAAVSGSTALRPGYQALLAAIRGGGIDLVLAESLDRISRDQEHVAAFYKQATFASVRVVTLAEGEISELHVGLKGTMGALFLRDLADKTRRGLEGRVRSGRSGGGLCFGYRVVRGVAGRYGEPERGLRAMFVAAFTAEWNRLVAEAGAGLAGKQRELEGVRRKLAGPIDAIADGLRAPGLQDKLDELEARRSALEAESAGGAARELPRLHPNLAEVYRERVERLWEALAGGSGGVEVLEAARMLIERVEVHPPEAGGREPQIELVGHLASMLRAAGAFGSGDAKSPPAGADGLEVFLRSVKMDAGTGFEPVTFRL